MPARCANVANDSLGSSTSSCALQHAGEHAWAGMEGDCTHRRFISLRQVTSRNGELRSVAPTIARNNDARASKTICAKQRGLSTMLQRCADATNVIRERAFRPSKGLQV